MESKKLQQFQQANSHLAPKPMPPPKGFSGNEYHPRSPLFGPVPVHSQYQNMALNFGHDTQIYDRGLNDNENLQMDHQIYQNQRFYQPRTHMHPNYQTHMHPNQVMNQPNPSQMHQHPRQLQEQYRQIQQAKLQQQMQFQNQAMLNQQQTFATRQTQHFHQNPKVDEMPVTPHRQNMINPVNEHRNVPTTLNVHPQQMGYYDEYNIQNMNMNNQIDKMSNQLAHQNMNKNHPYSNQYPMKQLNSTPIQSDLIQSTNYQSNQHSLPDSAYTNPTTKPVHYVGPTPLQTSPNQNTLHSPQSPQSSSVMLSPDKRRGSGGNQALRAPIARRPVSAPVTISGWLHKQGSDGLKVWRKRWFVLTEYCLFYYKGPEEEKLLGSVLLPSYHISACSPEEKNFRRYSFRCEHANMRTYLLAADTQSSMAAWLRAFKLASLMQCSSESDQASQSQSQPSLTSLNQSGDNSDSGIHTLPSQGKIAGTQTSPINSPQSGALDNIPLPGQPLYANAPPKPRRSNDGGYSSPSPECSLERYDEPSYDIRREAQNRLHQSRLNAKSPIPSDAIYESHSHQYHPSHPYHPGHPNRPPPPRTNAKSPEPLYNAQNLSLPLQNTAQMRLDHNKSPVMRLPKNKSPYYPDYQYNNPETVSPRRPHNNEVENSENIIRAPQRFLDKTDEYDIYGQNYKQHMNELRQNELYIQSKQNQKYPPMSPSERRTPDTYGRSRSTQVVRNNDVKNATRNVADYEDIYNGPPNEELIRYQRPMSPVVVDTEKRVIPMPQRYTPSNLDLGYSQIPVKMRIKQSPQQKNNRPHSADFLEYEAKQQSSQHIYQPQRQAPRPKSSLDINRSPLDAHGDNLYYSEAGYAEKMRQSAQYLQKTPKTVIASQAARKRYEDRFDLVQKRINKEGDIIYSNSPSNMEISGFNSKMTEVQPYSQDTIMSDGLLSQSRDSEEISRVSDYQRQGSSSVPRSYKEHDNGLHFIRSASARLARPNRDDESGASKDGARKVQQREESMKRLLEWKQRMLQSPLTRKVPPSLQTVSRLSRMGSPLGTLVQGGSITRSVGAHIRKPLPNNYNSYSSDDEDHQSAGRITDNDTDTVLDSTRETKNPNYQHFARPKTPTTTSLNTTPSLTNLIDVDTFVNNTPKETNNALKEPIKSSMSKSINVNYIPVYAQHKHLQTGLKLNDIKSETKMQEPLKLLEQKYLLTKAEISITSGLRKLYLKEKPKPKKQSESENPIKEIESRDEDVMEYTDKDLDEILCQNNVDVATNIISESIYVSSDIQSEINLTDDLNSSDSINTLACKTPTNENIEEHYMTMTPKKSISGADSIVEHMNIFSALEIEESPYVEMTQGLLSTISEGDKTRKSEDAQSYEQIIVSDEKVEPLYMELNQFQTGISENIIDTKPKGAVKKSNVKKYHDIKTIKKNKSTDYLKLRSDLPDILKASQNTILSDSSDADDEASRDLDSLDTPCHPRFSLSDTFRPASYYLGCSRAPQDFPDSSDSEIVSPPPIPTTPLLINDFDTRHDNYLKKLNKIHSSNPVLHGSLNKTEKHKTSRHSLPEKDQLDRKKHEKLKKRSTGNDYTSLSKYNVDNKMYIEGHFKPSVKEYYVYKPILNSSITEESRSSDIIDSERVELRHPIVTSDSLERRLKRRPLSEESMSEINSVESNFDETIESIDLDHYLKELQVGDISNYTKVMYPAPVGWRDDNNAGNILTTIDDPKLNNTPCEKFYENLSPKNSSQLANISNTNIIIRPPSRMSNLSTSDTILKLAKINSPQQIFQNNTYYDSLEEREDIETETSIVASLREKNLSLHDANVEIMDRASNPAILQDSPIVQDDETVSLNVDLASVSHFELQQSTPIHSRDNSNISEQSAPYYYSDLTSRHSSNQDIASSSSQIDGRMPLNCYSRLNNTRLEGSQNRKTGIIQIQNPIRSRESQDEHSNRLETYKLAAEARSVSAEFLSNADKSDCIDKRNLYESDTLKRKKAMDSITSLQTNPETKNLFSSIKYDKTVDGNCLHDGTCHSSSLEGLLEDVLIGREGINPVSTRFHLHEETFQTSSSIVDMLLSSATNSESNVFNSTMNQNIVGAHSLDVSNVSQSENCEGDMLWEEDTLWRESLRRVSHRHARSLDDLDSINTEKKIRAADAEWGISNKTSLSRTVKPRLSSLSRGATYVNDNNSTPNRKSPKKRRKRTTTIQESDSINDDEYVQLAFQPDNELQYQSDDGVYEVLTQKLNPNVDTLNQYSEHQRPPVRSGFEIDREKLRQWDWMSSGLMKNESGCFGEGQSSNGQRGNSPSASSGAGKRDFTKRGPRAEPSDGNIEASGSVSFAGLAPPLPKQQSHQQQGSRENIPVAGGIPIRAVSPRVRLSQENLMLSSGQIKDPAPYHLRDHTNPHPSASENIMPDEIYARNKYQPAHYHEEQYSRRDMELKHNKYNDQLYDTRNNKYGDYHIYGTADILNKVHQNHNELNSQHYRTSDDNCGDVGSNGDKLKGDWTIKRGNNQVDDQHFMDREATGIRHLDMSAGDLLGRTHEELVLLLIQLRRQNTSTARAIEQCCTQVHQCQSRLSTTDSAQRLENLQRLDQLKQHLLDLEKQYEKSKPLVNLVDNMVKLGALYRGSPHPQVSSVPTETATLDRLEFNQRIQERRLLQEERKHWDRLSPNQMQLQSKVKQLYQLDQLLQEESGTLQGLQRDKEALERALGGLRTRLQGPPRDPVLLEQARRQQQTLENELSRVHLLLAHNSKKLEQTVAGNARLEQELLVLRQKLQESRGARGSQQISNQGAPDSVTYAGGATALLESELRRVQLVVGDLQRQRQELSSAVKQLTDKSQCLVQQIQPRSTSSSNLKKRSDLSWLETDLDSLETCEHGAGEWTESVNSSSTTPLYIDTTPPEQQMHGSEDDTTLEATESDLEQSGFPNLATQEKQEIKTVRIVKRESERRQRDRERSTGPSWGNHSSQNLDQVIEEETRVQNEEYQRSLSLPRSFHHMPLSQSSPVLSPTDNTYQHIKYTSVPQNHNVYNTDFYTRNNNDHLYESETNVPASTNNPFAYDNRTSVKLDTSHPFIATACSKEDHSRPLKLTQKSESIASLNRSIELSPVFKSEAAKQIVNEMLVTIDVPGTSSEGTNEQAAQISAHNQRRTVPKEKRRHYTAPHHLSSKSLLTMQAENDFKTTSWRARDDLDMERALRPRSNAPDVVRSTMVANHESNTGHDGDLSELVLMRDARSTVYARDPKFTETTIDKLLAAPSKILIPERYIPEQVPEPTPEELERRQQKAESIRKMLSTTPMGPTNKTSPEGPMKEEKRQREHLLQLNQILAKQVMEMSKIVAVKALASLPLKAEPSFEDDDSSPTPLPLYQQRDNFFT